MNAAEKKRKNRFKMRMIKVGVVLACLVVLVLLGLLIRWIVLSIQGNTNKLDKASISAYEKINKSIVQITEDSSYIEMSISDRKEIIIEELERLEREGAVNSDSIVYQQDNEMIWYKWGDGYVAGIMLSEFGEDLSGNADKNEFVTELASDFPGWKNLTSPDQWKSEINFSNASYPFSESDLINLNLKAKYMFGICDANDTTSGYYKYLIAYRGNMQSWNKSHLSTEIDEYCTVDDFKSGLSGYNLVIIEEHGNYDYAKTPMICTEESVGNIAQYSDDLKNQYIATIKDTSGSTCYWIYPSFFEHYYSDGKLEDTIIWLGSCHGYQNPDLANALEACGAEAVVGFSDSVYTAYDACLHTAFVHSLMWGDSASEALYFAKDIFKYSDTDAYAAKWYDFKGKWKEFFSSAKARINVKGESARLINLVKKEEQGKRSIQLSVFAMEADNLDPITSGDIELIVDNPEITCTNPKQTIQTVDGSVIFDLTVNTKSRTIDSKLTWQIDGYKDFTYDNYSIGTDSSSMNLCDLIFEKEAQQTESPTETEPEGTTMPEDIHEDEDEFFEYLEDDYEDYDYGVPLEDMIAWTYHNGHLYALFDYAVSAKVMNLVSLADPSVHLVTITDADEQSAVEELIAVGGRNIYYTGGLVDENGRMYWINGESANYANWYTGCPDSYNEEGYDDIVVIYRGAESPAENDSDFGIWLEVLEDDYSYLDIFDFDLDGITRGIIIEWDDPGVYGLDQN